MKKQSQRLKGYYFRKLIMLLRVLVVYFFFSFFCKRISFVNASVTELLIKTRSLINKKIKNVRVEIPTQQSYYYKVFE